MITLYVSNNGPCSACEQAEETIAQWKNEGRLTHKVSIKPVPDNPGFKSFVRVKTGGRWGYPLLFNNKTQELVLGFPRERYETMLCA